ncbi:carbohydrate ABC transporter permease [Anaerocolumna sp. AGMB13025]|uniref:carbohydrate ABC transporter permease n=1 Tax=Anaerocolumna sp. AGMB13025 TaxID=3039116 RepID=UPI00241E1F12|nr:carbohydrate ABC transporter permease [Anaerocolumna sp. AGMB13025]WFR55736.1 carbohydrate ABC transporter permease [Anaerocolumna sp. AGMB13025]
MIVERKKSPARITFKVGNTLFLSFIIFVCILPVWHVVCASFSDAGYVMQNSGVIWRIKGFNINGYKLVFQNISIWTGYLNTFLYVLASTLIGMFITVMVGYTVSRKNTLWGNAIMFLMAFTMLFNGGMIASYIINTQLLGLYNNRLAMILPTSFGVFNVILIRTAIMGIPDSLEESANMDGAGKMTILFKIIIPLIKPTIATIVLFSVVAQWNSWFNASIYLRNRDLFPLQLILKEILVTNDTSATTSAASSSFSNDSVMYKQLVKYCVIVVSTAPIFAFYPFVQKYFEKGVMVGAIKG